MKILNATVAILREGIVANENISVLLVKVWSLNMENRSL